MKISRAADKLEIIETQRYIIAYAALSILSGLLAVMFGLLTRQELLPIFMGILFIAVGLFMGWTAETVTTLFNTDGTIVIKYERIMGHKTWVRRLNRSNIQKLDYVKTFDETTTFLLSKNRMSTIYLFVDFGEQIKIGSRYRISWAFSKFGIPIVKKSIPLDTEANEIAAFLNVPLNTIEHMRAMQSVKNFYNPRDKMRPVLQRPTQEQLDRENR